MRLQLRVRLFVRSYVCERERVGVQRRERLTEKVVARVCVPESE